MYVIVDGRVVGRVRWADNIEEVHRFIARGRRVLGCMNGGANVELDCAQGLYLGSLAFLLTSPRRLAMF